MISSRRVLAVFAVVTLAACLSFALATPGSAAPGFGDILGVWGESEILKLQAAKIVSGFNDNSFRPEGCVSRAEFATFLARAKGWPVPSAAKSIYRDVDSRKWYATYVNAAIEQNALIGNSGQFRPEASITLGEVVAAAIRARYSDEEISAIESPIRYLAKYADVDSTPAWARKYLAVAIRNGIYPFRVSKDLLRAAQPATRSEVAVVIARILPDTFVMVSSNINEAKGSDKPDAPYTGLVIDARGLKLARSMSPRVVSEFAGTIWDVGVRDIKVYNANTYYGYFEDMDDKAKDYVLERGIVSYAKSPSDPCIKERCGDNPLIIRAVRRTHSADDWVVISQADGRAIEAADKISGFRKAFKVSILLEK